jgi:nickel-dependent lactate racemase
MRDIILPDRNNDVCFRIEERLLGEIVAPRGTTPGLSPDAAIRAALDAPIRCKPVRDMATSGSRVCVIIDDITRITPTHLILPHVLRELSEAGVPDEAVSITLALGTHRPMTEDEIRTKLGEAVADRYRVVNAPSWDESNFQYLGTSRAGIPAWVHKSVAEADVRIGIGMITPHLDAGFSGGAKIILPGVCGARTVEAFHAGMAYVDENQLGITDAKLRLDLEAFVAETVPLDCIVNVVLDRSDEVYACVAGHPVAAHRVGAERSMEVYGTPVSRKYPVVVANAYPCGEDFWQATKGLAAAEGITEDGGTIILVADCSEGFAEHPRFPEYSALGVGAIRSLLESGGADDPVAAGEAAALSRIRSRFRLSLVSRGMPGRKTDYGFSRFDTVEAAVADALARVEDDGDGSVAVLTHGGFSAPYLSAI